MVELQQCGALERCRTFPQNPRIKDVLEKSKGMCVAKVIDVISAVPEQLR
jgi:hypothetical protein